MALFSTRTDIEKELEKLYTAKFASFGLRQKDIRQAIGQCKKDSKREGTDDMPKYFGDHLISKAINGDEKSKRFIDKSKAGGANEDDIRHWWNLHDLERRIIKWEDNIFRILTFENYKQEGFSDQEAANNLRQTFPIYGDPTDESITKDEDRPLPDELHDRVNRMTIELTPIYIQQYSKDYSSMNAFLRDKLRQEEK